MESHKPVHSIILDAGPILKNDPSVSTLLAKCETLYTIPAIISEIRDPGARLRVESTLLPFLIVRNPKPQSIKFVQAFARKTGDLPVLSTPDIEVLALAYELECEQNGSDWRLRKAPNQRGMNGKPPNAPQGPPNEPNSTEISPMDEVPSLATDLSTSVTGISKASASVAPGTDTVDEPLNEAYQITQQVNDLRIQRSPAGYHKACPTFADGTKASPGEILANPESESSDSEGWITPSNLKKHQAEDGNASTVPISEDMIMQVGTMTSDYAMQNVLLQVGLNLISTSIDQIKNIRTYLLRCHACFEKVKDMTRQFCPKCGKPSLTRVSCSTNAKGEFKLHLKKNMQWNHRGDRYSIPKPVSGSANGKVGHGKRGGKSGWGQGLVLAEDQKEYQRALNAGRRKETDLMDEDYLPGILTGDRGRAGGRPKIGAGRNVNSRRRL